MRRLLCRRPMTTPAARRSHRLPRSGDGVDGPEAYFGARRHELLMARPGPSQTSADVLVADECPCRQGFAARDGSLHRASDVDNTPPVLRHAIGGPNRLRAPWADRI